MYGPMYRIYPHSTGLCALLGTLVKKEIVMPSISRRTKEMQTLSILTKKNGTETLSIMMKIEERECERLCKMKDGSGSAADV